MQIFIAFEGTDYNGNHLVSSSTTVSKFVDQNVNDMYANMESFQWTKGYVQRQERTNDAQILLDM